MEQLEPNVWTFNEETDDPLHIIVRGIEADVNSHGWDNHARLGVVLEHESVSLADGSPGPKAFAVCEVPMFSEFYENPASGLAMWNTNLLRDTDAVNHLTGEILAPIKENFCGWILISESWSGDEPENPETPRQEGRVCVLVTTSGRIIRLVRSRNMDGGLDEITLYDTKDENVFIGGFVIWNLIVLTTISEVMIDCIGKNVVGLF